MEKDTWHKIMPFNLGNIHIIRHYIEAFDLNFWKSEEEIAKAFESDSNIKDVIDNRIYLINAYYHTHVPRDKMKKGIKNINNLDYFIESGKENAVEEVSKCTGDKNYFSFATKYCCFSNPDKYPIFDSFSSKTLNWFNNRDYFCEDVDLEEIRKGRKYDCYRNIVNKFRKEYKLKDIGYKDLDKFLWLVGENL